jgi:hypothetical protein
MAALLSLCLQDLHQLLSFSATPRPALTFPVGCPILLGPQPDCLPALCPEASTYIPCSGTTQPDFDDAIPLCDRVSPLEVGRVQAKRPW